MSFMLTLFAPNLVDVYKTKVGPKTVAQYKAELLSDHRISQRRFVADLLPKGGVGAEIGVFTGLFSPTLLRHTGSRKVYFIDPWWEVFGDYYPDWGLYTANGALPTTLAHASASERIEKNAGDTEHEIIVTTSDAFLSGLPDKSLDWVYLDSTHDYEGTKNELRLLKSKLKPGGIIVGDDWHEDKDHPHAGVAAAVNEAVAAGAYEFTGSYPALQWGVRLI